MGQFSSYTKYVVVLTGGWEEARNLVLTSLSGKCKANLQESHLRPNL